MGNSCKDLISSHVRVRSDRRKLIPRSLQDQLGMKEKKKSDTARDLQSNILSTRPRFYSILRILYLSQLLKQLDGSNIRMSRLRGQDLHSNTN